MAKSKSKIKPIKASYGNTEKDGVNACPKKS